jgi:RNA polymerase sigma factor (sigma-70 family)
LTSTTSTQLNNSKKYSEEFLCSGLRSKSKTAFEYLYDNYSAALYGIVFNILHQEEASNDALQEVFVKIWNNFDSYDAQRSRLYTWMANIARNHAIDKLRSKTFKGENSLKTDKEFVNNTTVISQFVDGIGLKKLVDDLEEEQKAIIDLLYYKGFTQSEAAEELSIPLGTVKSRARLAMNKLRKYFT